MTRGASSLTHECPFDWRGTGEFAGCHACLQEIEKASPGRPAGLCGRATIIPANKQWGISGRFYTQTCEAFRDMPHTQKIEKPHRFDRWGFFLRLI